MERVGHTCDKEKMEGIIREPPTDVPDKKRRRTAECSGPLKITRNGVSVSTATGLLHQIVPPNSNTTETFAQIFGLSGDNHDTVKFGIYEGNGRIPKPENLLGDVLVCNIPRAPRGVLSVMVKIQVTDEGSVRIKYEDSISQTSKTCYLKHNFRQNESTSEVAATEVSDLEALTQLEMLVIRANGYVRANRDFSDETKAIELDKIRQEIEWLSVNRSSSNKQSFDARRVALTRELHTHTHAAVSFDGFMTYLGSFLSSSSSGSGGGSGCGCGEQIVFGCPTHDSIMQNLRKFVHRDETSTQLICEKEPEVPKEEIDVYILFSEIEISSISAAVAHKMKYRGKFLHFALGFYTPSTEKEDNPEIKVIEVEAKRNENCKPTGVECFVGTRLLKDPYWVGPTKTARGHFRAGGYDGFKVNLTRPITVQEKNKLCAYVARKANLYSYDPAMHNCIDAVYNGVDFLNTELEVLDVKHLQEDNFGFHQLSTEANGLHRLARRRYTDASIENRFTSFEMKAKNSDKDQ